MATELLNDEGAEHVHSLEREPKRFIGDVRVYFRCRYARVAEQPLNDANVDARFYQKGCCRMPQHMGRHPTRQTRLPRNLVEFRADGLGPHLGAEAIRK